MSEVIRKVLSLPFCALFLFLFLLVYIIVFRAFLRSRAKSQFVIRHSEALLQATLCKCQHCDLWVVTSNGFSRFPTAWEQPSHTKGGFLSPYQDQGPLLELAIVS